MTERNRSSGRGWIAERGEVQNRGRRQGASRGIAEGTESGGALAGWRLALWWGRMTFRYRNLLFPLLLWSLVIRFPPQDPWGSEALHDGLVGLGLALALAGQSLRAAVTGSVNIGRSGKNNEVYAEELITEGLFRHSRNPLYLGNLLILSGLFMMHNNGWVYAVGVPFFGLTYAAMAAAEEAYLRSQFGAEYEAYFRRTNRWWPNLRHLGRSVRGRRFSWRRVIRQEHGSAYAWCATALLLLVHDTLVRAPSDQRRLSLNGLVALLAIATLVWAAARVLLKAGRLTDCEVV